MDWFLYDIGLRHERVKSTALRLRGKVILTLNMLTKTVPFLPSFSTIYQEKNS